MDYNVSINGLQVINQEKNNIGVGKLRDMEQIIVKERGRIDYEGIMYTPQNMAFPAAVCALKVFMGLGMRTREIHAHNMTWVGNLDYYFQVGVSTEGFGLFYHLPQHVIKHNIFDKEPLKDCLEGEGLQFRLITDPDVQFNKDTYSNGEELIEIITKHLRNNLPALILTNENIVILATGFTNNGKTIRGWVFMDGGDNTNKSFDPDYCQFIDNWTETTFALILIFEPKELKDRKEICINALKRGSAMMSTVDCKLEGYGYGKALYRNWIHAIQDDRNYIGDVKERPYIDPEIWDLAERRAWVANFIGEAKKYIEDEELEQAEVAFMEIHNKMWEINGLCSEDKVDKLKEKDIRFKIINLIKECETLEEEAAECIKIVLSRC